MPIPPGGSQKQVDDYHQTLDLQERQRRWDRKKEYAVAALQGRMAYWDSVELAVKDALQAADLLDQELGERPQPGSVA